MLYHLLYPLHTMYGFFRVIRYISFRTLMAILTSLVISFLLGPGLIRKLKKYQIGQQIRDDGPQSHLTKSGTPTMGGILIVFSFIISFLLWARLDQWVTWIVVGCTLGYAMIGFWDDYSKLSKKQSKGLSAGGKFKFQLLVAPLVAMLMIWSGMSTELHFPFFKDAVIDLTW